MNKKKLTHIKDEWIYYALILLGTVLFWVPYLSKGFFATGENDFHFARIMTLADSLQMGVFPAKVRLSHMHTYGYGIGFFYPDLLIYPPSILIALGADYEITVKVYLFVLFFLGGVLVYHCFKKASGNAAIAIIGEILYMGSGLNDHNLFDGGGIPHFFSYLFLPLLICGLLEALRDEKEGYIKYAIGLGMVFLTHSMIFITFMFIMVIIVLVHGGVIIKNVRMFAKLFGVSVAVMMLTTSFWLPAFEQIQKIAFKCFNSNAYNVKDYILPFRELVFTNLGVLYFSLFVLSAIVYVVLLIKRKTMPLDVTCIFVTTALTLWLMCSRLFWTSEIGKTLNFFEYTSRFEFVAVALVVIFVVLVAREASLDSSLMERLFKKGSKAVFIAGCVAVIVLTRFLARPDFWNLLSGERVVFTRTMLEEQFLVSLAEWLPVECEPSVCLNPETATADDGSGADGVKHENGKYFDVWLDLTKSYYDMPYIYYYGFKAYLLDENENPVRELVTSEAFDDNGYLRVTMPEDVDGIGHVLVTYRKTSIQKISYLVSAATALLLIVLVAVSVYRNGKRVKVS